MNCGNCKHFWALEKVCRRHPPQGFMRSTPSTVVGVASTIHKISFFPPVNIEMVCGEHELETNNASTPAKTD